MKAVLSVEEVGRVKLRLYRFHSYGDGIMLMPVMRDERNTGEFVAPKGKSETLVIDNDIGWFPFGRHCSPEAPLPSREQVNQPFEAY